MSYYTDINYSLYVLYSIKVKLITSIFQQTFLNLQEHKLTLFLCNFGIFIDTYLNYKESNLKVNEIQICNSTL